MGVDADQVDQNVVLRYGVQESGAGSASGVSTDDYQLQYSLNGGAFTNVTGSSVVVKGFDSASLTDAAATTSRLSAGTGSFVAGEICEADGLLTDWQLTANNYSDLLFAITIVAADVKSGDRITFRVLRNAGIFNTYSVTPVLHVSFLVSNETDSAHRITPGVPRALETDSAQSFTVQKVKALTVAAETDTAGIFTISHLFSGALEIDSAYNIVPSYSRATEADSGQGLTARKVLSYSLAPETDSAGIIEEPASSVEFFAANEADTSLEITPYFASDWSPIESATTGGGTSLPFDLALETDAAQSLSRTKTRILGNASETDLAFYINDLEEFFITNETDAAQAIAKTKTKAYTASTESDAAQSLTPQRVKTIGIASETDAAQAVSRRKVRDFNVSTESDIATTITASGTSAYSQANEVDSAQAVTPVRRVGFAFAAEVDSTQSISAQRKKSYSPASETDLAEDLFAGYRKALETDTAHTISPIKRQSIGVATESAVAQAINHIKSAVIEVVLEVDSAQDLNRRKIKSISLSADLEAALAFGHFRKLLVGTSIETDIALFLIPNISAAAETDEAMPIVAIVAGKLLRFNASYQPSGSFNASYKPDGSLGASKGDLISLPAKS